MLLEHERNYGLGMDALGIVCSGNTNGIMVWACTLWLSYALGTRTLLWFGHKFSGYRKRWEHERCYGLGLDALVRMHLEHERYIRACMLRFSYALGTRTLLWFGGMDALVISCSWNMNIMTVWAWMQWFSHTLETRTLSWFGHCSNRVHGIYAVFRALETLRRCASCHASHIRRGRQSMHFFSVYAPAEPGTMNSLT